MTAAAAPARRWKVAFVFTGGLHQALHIAPAAAELQASAEVVGFALSESHATALKALFARLGAPGLPVRVMSLGPLDRGDPPPLKLVRLLAWLRELRRFDALVTTERTSTVLKFLPGAAQPMIHIPHGAGDRAKGFERRIARFDHVIVSGEKDRRRLIAEGLLREEQCDVSGSIKMAAVRRLSGPPPDFFGNGKPTILYNPHFDPQLSSWSRFARPVIERVARDDRFNLIVAPHVRLAEALGARERAGWEGLAVDGRVLVDFGSERSIDMSYTRSADIYLGDVSSQIYEFIAEPRPCVFLDAHARRWRDDPSFAMWRFGAVATNIDEAMAELGRAAGRHEDFVETQRAAAVDALGESGDAAPALAARQILGALERLTHP